MQLTMIVVSSTLGGVAFIVAAMYYITSKAYPDPNEIAKMSSLPKFTGAYRPETSERTPLVWGHRFPAYRPGDSDTE